MLSNLKLYCQAYDWSGSVAIQDCNFFSTETATATGDRINLIDYMLYSDSLKIKKDFDESFEDGSGQRSLFFIASDISITLSDWKQLPDGDYLQDFFYMYQTSSSYDRIKFKAQLYYDDVLIFQGIIPRENISENFSNDSTDRTIKLNIISWEKEFKEYYINQGLPSTSDLVFTGTKQSGKLYLDIQDVLDYIFSGITVTIPETSITDWRVCEKPEFYRLNDSSNFYWQRCGYYNVREAGENCYDFLYKLCMSMGWVFFMMPVSGDMHLVIKNVYTFDTGISIKQLNVNQGIKAGLTRMKAKEQFDNLVILNGTMQGGDNAFPNGSTSTIDHRGERLAVYSEISKTENNYRHFSNVNVDSSPNKYTLESVTNDTFSKYYSQDDTNFSYSIFVYTSSTANGYENKSILKNNTLYINGGQNSEIKQRVQLTDGGEAAYFESDPTELDDYDLVYSGCYGEMLYQYHSSISYDYQDYVNGEAFGDVIANQLKLNYKKYLNYRNSNLLMEYITNEFIIDNLQIIQFKGDLNIPYSAAADNKWSITSIESDPVNDITRLELVGQL